MADPLSIILGVVGIASATLQSAKQLFQIIDDIKNGPDELNAVSRDVYAFYSITFALIATLKEDRVRNVVGKDSAMVEMVQILGCSLTNCQALLGQLMVNIQSQFDPGSNSHGSRVRLVNLKWPLLVKGKIRTLQLQLEATKSTLCSVLNAFSLLCNVRGVALGQMTLGLQLKNPVPFLVHETHRGIISEQDSLHRRYAQIDPQYGETVVQSDQLRLTRHQHRKSNEGRILDPTDATDTAEGSEHHLLERNSRDESYSSAIDVFYDCVSRLSLDDASSSADKLRAKLRGSPNGYFETKSSVYPEQYSIESLFSEKICVYAMVHSQKNTQNQKYFLVSVHGRSAASRVQMLDNNEYCCKTLPNAFQNLLSAVLPQLKHFYTVTNLSLSLTENQDGQIAINSPRVDAVKDTLETQMSDEDQILQDIQHLNCPWYIESDVAVLWRLSSTRYHVQVGALECVEQKAPFANAGRPGENGFSDFCQDLKLLYSLRGCPSVVRFIGVVLDETRRHLKGYLYESLKIPCAGRVFVVAQSRSENIPWPVRETWFRQMIKAVSDVHEQNKIIGVLERHNIGLRADGAAILTGLKTSHRHISIHHGQMPPELRKDSESNEGAPHMKLNFQTDIFQLGFRLWLLAEHRSHCFGYLCAKSACTNIPRYSCTADHSNPVELPACSSGIPPYVNDIIRKCRSMDPRSRPSACSLLKDLPYTGEIKDHAPGIIELLNIYASRTTNFFMHCDECGSPSRELHYNCQSCFEGDFDLCQNCVARGIHCFDPQHRLMKRVFRNGKFVEE